MKKETLEEAAERLYPIYNRFRVKDAIKKREDFINGAKWQQERSYSDRDMEIAFGTMSIIWISFEEFIEQFKKK